jgi:HEAT repeat protein
LIKSLADPDSRVRKEASIALGQIGPAAAAAVPRVIALAFGNSEDDLAFAAFQALTQFGAPALPDLIELLPTRNPAHRIKVIWLLQNIGPAAAPALPSLQQALTDPDEQIRKLASDAIATITTDDSSGTERDP